MKKLTFKIIKKNSEAGLIFFTFGTAFTIAWALSAAAILMPLMLGLGALLIATGDASPIPLSQNIIIAAKSTFKVIQFSPIPGYLTSLFYLSHTKREYEPFRDNQGHLPIYRIQNAVIQSDLEYERLFQLCLDSLWFIGREGVQLIVSDKDSGAIKALVKSVKIFRYKGEIVEFSFERAPQNGIQVNLQSYSDVLVKGMDAAKNIKNLHDIYKYFKSNLSSEEVQVCLL